MADTDATNPSAKTGEPVDRESAHDAARRLFAVQYPGRSFDDLRQLSKISWFVAAYEELSDRLTHPQPSLSVGLDREAVADRIRRLVGLVASEFTGLEREAFVQNETDAILALAAPAEGYVLVPVEPTEAMLDATTNSNWLYHEDGAALTIYRAMIAACLPAAPTGETGA